MTQWRATRGRFGGFSGTPRANNSPDRVIPPLKLNIDRIDQGGCLAFPIPLDKSSDNRQESIGDVLALASLGPRNLSADTKSSAGLDLEAYTTRVGLTSTVWTCLRIGCRFGAIPLNLEQGGPGGFSAKAGLKGPIWPSSQLSGPTSPLIPNAYRSPSSIRPCRPELPVCKGHRECARRGRHKPAPVGEKVHIAANDC